MKIIRFCCVALLLGHMLIGVAGCTSEKVYEPLSKKDLAEGWAYSDSLIFSEVNWKDQKDNQSLKLRITFLDTFQFENVYLRGNFWVSKDSLVSKVFSIQLADKFGNWLGKCSSSVCKIDYDLEKEGILPFQGQFSMSVNQWTRDSLLTGISGLSLVWSNDD